MIITIDGPSASGKSSVAREIAQQLGYYYLSSGLLFRGLAYALVQAGYSRQQIEQASDADIYHVFSKNNWLYQYTAENKEQILLNGVPITSFLRTEEISQYASMLACHPGVRRTLELWQHQIAAVHNCVAEGRDMGTVVFPHADVKFFLTASVHERARRWQKDHTINGIPISYEQALFDITTRDERDAGREHAPLKIPDDAHIIDDTNMSKTAVIEHMLAIIRQAVS